MGGLLSVVLMLPVALCPGAGRAPIAAAAACIRIPRTVVPTMVPPSTLAAQRRIEDRIAHRLPEPAPDPWFGQDKLQHFFMSFAITSVGYGLARMAVDHQAAVGASIAAGAAAGIGKEIHDALAGSDASVRDLTWDALGIGVGTALTSQIR